MTRVVSCFELRANDERGENLGADECWRFNRSWGAGRRLLWLFSRMFGDSLEKLLEGGRDQG